MLKNFEAILEGYLSEGTEEMKRQIEFLIKQINSKETNEEVDSDIEDGDEDEEEDPIIMEANLDRSELITKQSADELVGESLLQSEYSINNEYKSKSRHGIEHLNDSSVLNRPMTPVHLRQSMLFQTKPFNTNELYELNRNNHSQIIDKKTNIRVGNDQMNNNNNSNKKSTNILVINSDDMTGEDYSKPPPPPPNAGFVSRPKIQRTPDQSMTIKTKYDSLNTNSSIQSTASSTFTPKYSITEPRPSSANSAKSTKSPSQSNQSTSSTLK